MRDPDLLAAVGPVADAFEKLGVPYYIGGSIASSAYGVARATLDIDMASELKPQHVPSLVRMLESSYYIDPDTILEAIQGHSSFNLVHLDTMIKVDVFVIGDDPYPKQALRRRRKDTLEEDRQGSEFYLASPEDIVLFKLDWYRKGGQVSERQWGDIVGVLKVQDKSLDREYLRHWASDLKLTDLLERAVRDAGIQL
jgi:hypothetical protein